jgi:hypothetical protein
MLAHNQIMLGDVVLPCPDSCAGAAQVLLRRRTSKSALQAPLAPSPVRCLAVCSWAIASS